jgi:hypothetical protein
VNAPAMLRYLSMTGYPDDIVQVIS